jgi:Na+-translocating ferredoxin:NAD+ oxidoreductase RnfC subunit
MLAIIRLRNGQAVRGEAYYYNCTDCGEPLTDEHHRLTGLCGCAGTVRIKANQNKKLSHTEINEKKQRAGRKTRSLRPFHEKELVLQPLRNAKLEDQIDQVVADARREMAEVVNEDVLRDVKYTALRFPIHAVKVG